MIPTTELHNLNFRFLLLLQQGARTDIATTEHTFGVAASVCEKIATFSLDQLDELSKTNALIFRGRIDDATLALLANTSSPGLRAVLVQSRSS